MYFLTSENKLKSLSVKKIAVESVCLLLVVKLKVPTGIVFVNR